MGDNWSWQPHECSSNSFRLAYFDMDLDKDFRVSLQKSWQNSHFARFYALPLFLCNFQSGDTRFVAGDKASAITADGENSADSDKQEEERTKTRMHLMDCPVISPVSLLL